MAATQKRKSASPPAKKTPPKGGPEQGPTPLLEWAAAAVGLVVLGLTVGVVASEAFTPDKSPAAIVVERLGVSRTDAGYLVQVRATNRGGSPAAQVVVEGELQVPGAPPQTAEATFDFIADHSSSEGGLFFTEAPSEGTLILRAKGYAAP